MERTSVQKLARVLRVLVIITFVCNLIALLLVALALNLYHNGISWSEWVENIFHPNPLLKPDLPLLKVLAAVINSYTSGLRNPYICVLILFLWACGGCTAAILWQGKRVLDTILRGEPFSPDNAANLKRAAVCCFLISAAAFLRLVWVVAYVKNMDPLFTYNALFVPIFLMAGLLCMVMSALFRQAAELKAENDLTI